MTQPHWNPAYVGIGSNLDSPADQVANAIVCFAEISGGLLVSQSGLYRSAPHDGNEQPDYINAVVAFLTRSGAREFLHQLQAIEDRMGRIRTERRWDSRIIDLDLLAYASLQLDDEELTLPHPGIADRNFVLLPWNEIAPQYIVPGLGKVCELAAEYFGDDQKIERLS